MAHKIAEAVIENRQLKYIGRNLPSGKLKVHIVYDEKENNVSKSEASKIVRDTYGMYKDVDVIVESKKLRADWERRTHE